jgi:prepilin-type N-terminal cleavage/methylation domain-containing protein
MQNNQTPTVISSAPPRRRSGFTLIELLVVLTLTVLLASFAVIYSRQSGTQIALYIEAQKMAELVFKAKSLALTAYQNPSLGHICGFGFAIDYSNREYYLFSYGVPPATGCGAIVDVDSGLISPLPGQRYVLSSNLTLQNSSDPLYYVLFIPPNPTTIISNNTSGGHSDVGLGRITLQAPNGVEMTIDINTGGQINF